VRIFQLNLFKIFLSFCVVFFTITSASSQDAATGEQLFKVKCAACHAPNKKIIGPPLNEALGNWDNDKEAMYVWVRNWQEAVEAGYPRAVEVQDYDASAMNFFPELTDEDLDNIWAYIDNPAPPPPPPGGKDVSSTGIAGPWYSNINFGLFGLLILFAVISLVLAAITQNLERFVAKKEGIDLGKQESLLQKVFNKKVMMTLSLLAFIVIGFTAYKSAANLGRSQGYAPAQPINYSHKIHAGQLGIDCQYCHTAAATSKSASIPSVNKCMNCHNSIDIETLTAQGQEDIQKIWAATGWNPDTRAYDLEPAGPIEWVRIHNLPDHVYFNHAQHVSAGKIKCQTCHGEIQEMEVVAQHSNLSMGWCIDCHRKTEVQFTENAYYENLYEEYHDKLNSDDKKYKDFFVSVEKIGGTECQKCHY